MEKEELDHCDKEDHLLRDRSDQVVTENGGNIEATATGDEPDATRETWGKKIDFLLSVIGFAVDLANVWRFPYLCYKNGGGAFLVPYIIMLVFGGIPLFYMELALGQFHKKGAISCWGTICPIFKGIGWAVVLIAFFTDFFYNVIISWALYYFFASFTTKLPWTECGEWATENCYSKHMHGGKFPYCEYKSRIDVCRIYQNATGCLQPNISSTNCSMSPNSDLFNYPLVTREEAEMSSFQSDVSYLFNTTTNMFGYNETTDTILLNSSLMSTYCDWRPDTTSPAAEYFTRGVLGLQEASGLESVGNIKWQNALCLLAIYIICYFSLWKGISTSGKVVWFTAVFPYIVLFILLVRGVTLPGSMDGILEYITPKFDKIQEPAVWVDAATQVFFSLGPGFGVLLAFASYNKFHNNVYRDAIATSLINCATSFLAGFVVFSILGYLSHKTCKEFYDVAQGGPGLVFEVYPEAIATLPGSTFWSLIFFLMLLTLGLDSSFGGSEAIITGITDEFPILKKKREYFVAVLFITYFLIGLASCTYGGFYVVRIFEVFSAGYSILFAVFFESLIVSWIYGVFRFSSDIKQMIGAAPGIFWVSCWTFIAPLFLAFIMIYGLIEYEPLASEISLHQKYVFPPWANVLGWFIAGSSMAMIPIVGVIQIIIHRGDFRLLFNGWWSREADRDSPSCFSSAREDLLCGPCRYSSTPGDETQQQMTYELTPNSGPDSDMLICHKNNNTEQIA